MSIFKIWPLHLYLITAIFAILSSFDGVAIGMLFKSLSESIQTGSTNDIYKLSLFFLGVYVVLISANYVYNVMINRFVRDCNVRIRNKIIANFLANDPSYPYNDESKTLSALLNDVKLFEENFTSVYFDIFRYIFWSLCSLVFTLVIDKKLAIIFIVFSALPSIWAFVFKKPLARQTEKWSEKSAEYTERAQETIQNRSTINEYGKHLLFEDRHNERNVILERQFFTLRNLQRLSIAATGMTSIISLIVPLCIGGVMVSAGYSTVANLLAIFMASDQILTPLQVALEMYNQVNTAKPIREKFEQILSSEPQQEAHQQFSRIELSDVTLAFDGQEMLTGVNLDLTYGDKVFISGESGSGKTILSKCIEGDISPAQGSRILTVEEGAKVAKDIIYTAQDNVIFSGTYNFNVTFDDNQQPEGYLTHVMGLKDLARTNAQITSDTISGGQAKRINVARALSTRENKLLVLDEPFQGLSLEQSAAIEQEIVSSNDFLVVVSHAIHPENLKLYNKFVYVHDRTIQVFDDPDDFTIYKNVTKF